MTDKVQKIREVIEKRYECWREKESKSHSIESEIRMSECQHLLLMVNSLQEEPVSVWHDASKETPAQGSNILMIRKEEKDTNYPPIAGCFHGTNLRLDGRNWDYYNGFCYNEIEPPVKWAYVDELLKLDNPCNIGKNLQEPQVKKSAETQHVNETCKENGNSLTQEPISEAVDFEQELYKAFGQIKDFTLGVAIAKRFYDMGRKHNEPVSEEFEEALAREWQGYNDRGAATVDALEDNTQELAFAKGFYRGAKWQKEQMMKDAVDACVTEIRTYYKEENEIDFTVMYEKGIIPYEMEQEVKVIVIKED